MLPPSKYCWQPAKEIASRFCPLFLESAYLMATKSAAFTQSKEAHQISQDLFYFSTDNMNSSETSSKAEVPKYLAEVILVSSYLLLLVRIKNQH